MGGTCKRTRIKLGTARLNWFWLDPSVTVSLFAFSDLIWQSERWTQRNLIVRWAGLSKWTLQPQRLIVVLGEIQSDLARIWYMLSRNIFSHWSSASLSPHCDITADQSQPKLIVKMVLKPKGIPKNQESPLASDPLQDLVPPFKNGNDCISKSDLGNCEKPKSLANLTNDTNQNRVKENSTDDANLSYNTKSEELSLNSNSGSKSLSNSEEISENRSLSKSDSKSESSLNDLSFSFDLETDTPPLTRLTEQEDSAKVLRVFPKSYSDNVWFLLCCCDQMLRVV